ncbi:MAG: hypothetical protein Q7J84_14710 [Sulfuricaulis sp.]|nr:hypothetical protein [Sulfuricaulis sp.]
MIIELGLADGVRYTSFAVNAVVFILWLKKRIVMNSFLAGRWEGVLTPNENPTTVYHCTLYITSHKGKDNAALLYYYKKNLDTDDIPVKGLDMLIEYNDAMFVFGRTWSPRFMRVFHKEGVQIISGSSATDESSVFPGVFPGIYNWNCVICSFLFKEKMQVTIEVAGETCKFSGFLRKE